MTTTIGYSALHDLSDPQRLAIDALVAGATHQQAAEAAGVHRVTVSKWASKHPGFQAELNRRREEMVAERRDRIRQMDLLALDAVSRGLEDGDAAIALGWLKLRRLATTDVDKVGPTDSEQIIDAEASRRLRATEALMMEDLLNPSAGTDRAAVREHLEQELARELDVDP